MKKITWLSFFTAFSIFFSGCGATSGADVNNDVQPEAETSAQEVETTAQVLEYRVLDDADIRNLKWGMSVEEVMVFEQEAEFVSNVTEEEEYQMLDEQCMAVYGKTYLEFWLERGGEYEPSEDNTLTYSITDNTNKILMKITVPKEKGMDEIQFRFYGNDSKDVLNNWKERLTEKYGSHTDNDYGKMYWYDSEKNFTVTLSHIEEYSKRIEDLKKDYETYGDDIFLYLIEDSEIYVKVHPESAFAEVRATIEPGKNSDVFSSSSSKKSGCEYKYSDGSICGDPVGSDGIFCSKHRKELDDTYNWLMGN